MTEIASPSTHEGSRSSSSRGAVGDDGPQTTKIAGGGRPADIPPTEIPSFRVRRGRTGPTSRDALERLWPVHGVDPPYDGLIRTARTVLEIGFGMGEATALMAAAAPEVDVVAVEVHPAGIAALLRRVETLGLTNVRVVDGDAVDVLHALPPGSLEEVRLYFPDPWPKQRHVKRRFLRPSHAALVTRALAPQGFLHLATDWPAYAEHARDVLAGWELVAERRDRPVTGYERRALAAGRVPVDLLARPRR